MSLDWSNERYVRLYTRDTDEWLVLPWQSRAVWPLLLRKVDRSGVLPAKLGARGVAVLIGLPVDVVEPGIAGLLDDGCLVAADGGYLVPNFIAAQESSSSDAQRKRDSRERRRAAALGREVTKRDQGVTNRDQESQVVTDGHDLSQVVTPCCAVPSRTDPDQPLLGLSRASARSHDTVVPAQPPHTQAQALDAAQPALSLESSPIALCATKPAKAPRPAKRQLPADWEPTKAHRALAKDLGVDADAEAASMRDWARAKAESCVDWDARFSGWLRRADGYSRRDSARAPPRPRDPRVGYAPARADSHTTPDGIVRIDTEL